MANPGWQCGSKSESVNSGKDMQPYNPSISHWFLVILEESGCATIETGWLDRHLILEDISGNHLGAIPCYLKNHSQGEYVFDYCWADAFEKAGGWYYLKLQINVPYTPKAGCRMLLFPGINE